MGNLEAIYCVHDWGDQMTGSDGAFRICRSACKYTWYDGQPEPKVKIGDIETLEITEEPYTPK